MGDEEAPVRTERAWFLSYFPRWGNQRANDPPSLTPITEIRMPLFPLILMRITSKIMINTLHNDKFQKFV